MAQRLFSTRNSTRQTAACRFRTGLQKFPLLRRPVPDRAEYQGARPAATNDFGDAHRLQGAVTDRPDDAQYLELPVAHVRTHLPAARMGLVLAVERVEEAARCQSAGQHQGLVAIVAVQPVLVGQMQRQTGQAFVPRPRHVKEGLSPARQLLLHPINLAP